MREFVFSLICDCSGAIVLFIILFIISPICLLFFKRVIIPIFEKITEHLQLQKREKENQKSNLLIAKEQKIKKRNIANDLWNELANMCLIQNFK